MINDFVSSSRYPFQRHPRTSAGLELNMQFNYYNYRKAPGVKYKWNWKFWEGLKTAPTICILSLRPKIGWKVRDVQYAKPMVVKEAAPVAGGAWTPPEPTACGASGSDLLLLLHI